MRRVLSKGWLAGHVGVVVLVVGFLWLGWWQLHRAEAGNPRSLAYALEWPLFAAFAVAVWVMLIRQELRTPVGGQREPVPGAVTTSAQAHARFGGEARSEHEIDEDGEELAAYNRYLAQLDAQQSERRRARRG